VYLALLAALYVGTAQLGLWLDAVGGFATAVWPPTGLALVALVLGGMRLWPGVALGAFLVNTWAGAPRLVAAGMAVGNTLEAVVGTVLLAHVVRFRPALDRLRDVVGLLGVAVLSTLVSATVGVTSGWLGGAIPAATTFEAWRTWWLGDMNGDLVVAALLFTWSARPASPLASRPLLEGGGLLLAVTALGLLVFGRPLGVDIVDFSYLFFPVLIWAALRFGPPGASAATALVSALAIWGTAQGRGPFTGPTFHESVLALQAFMSIVAATVLVLAAVVAERARAERRLVTHEALTRLIAEASSPHEAIPKVFQTICERLGWDMGVLWHVDREAQVLRYGESWHGPAAELAGFVAATRSHTFAPGVGLPGRVWAYGEPAWIRDVTEDPNFPRAPMAQAAGLRGAFAFPLRLGADLPGVMEFFSRERRPPDEELLRMVATVGGQLGHFLERARAEAALEASEAQLRLVTDSAPVFLARCDAEGRYRFVNRGYAERVGLSRDDVVGKRIPEVLGEDAYASVRAYVERVLSGEPVEFEVEVPYQTLGRRWVHGAYVPEHDGAGAVRGHIAVVTDVTARKRMEAQFEASLREKEVLLKEIHHRVKNNFQVVSSFLSLQASFIEAPELHAIFEECQHRIYAMALVHQHLYQAESLAAIDFGAYLDAFGAYLLRSYAVDPQRIQFTSTVEPVSLTIDTAIPCGLLVNELVSNALRHAFPQERAGHLWVTLRRAADGQLRLTVRDDGVGLPEGLDFQTASSFGLRLVGLLARQLRATLTLARHPGTSVTLTFVEPTYQAGGERHGHRPYPDCRR
jgi:PAS domain S-box-containing protein